MRKNIFGVIVILFVIFTCALVFNEIYNENTSDFENEKYYYAEDY